MNRKLLTALVLSLFAFPVLAQHSTANFNQSVNQRGTITDISAAPSSGLVVGTPVTFSSTLHTAGAPVVTSETIVIKDGATVIATVPITQATATNLLPYSLDFTKWTTLANGAAAPTLSLTDNGPDGSTNTATVLTFPATPGAAISGISYEVPGTAYANQQVTFSVWMKAPTATTVTLKITDDPQSTATQTQPCDVSTVWTRCVMTFMMPGNAGTGFMASVYETNAAAGTVSTWEAQFEQSSAAGPYVSTNGTSQSRQGGTVSYSVPTLAEGTHTITASYSGDANFLASVSQPLTLTVGKGTATIGLTSDSASSSYGSPVTFTATMTGPNGAPTGTVTFMDGATPIGTATLTGGVATLQTSTLSAGTHTITAVYAGDTQYNTVTSAPLTHTVSTVPASISVTSSQNPSTYGDSVVLTVKVTGTGGTPTGTVTVSDGATSFGTLTLDGTGTATMTSSSLTAGTHNLIITYSGDSNYF